jgi:hypothetical protein
MKLISVVRFILIISNVLDGSGNILPFINCILYFFIYIFGELGSIKIQTRENIMERIYLFRRTTFCFKVAVLILFLVNSGTGYSQGVPQYYNSNTLGNTGNLIPFGMGNLPPILPHNGVKYDALIGPSAFMNPSPAPSGRITKLYFQRTQIGINTDGTYTDLTIKLGQTSDTNFTAGQYFGGALTTVFYRANHSVTIGSIDYISFVLDNPFQYDPSQSLVIHVSLCGASTGGFSIYNVEGPVGSLRRNFQATITCQDSLEGQDSGVPNCGIDVNTTGIQNISTDIPASFTLKQNYPNPFNPVTNIEFSNIERGFVSLKIYDMLGKEVSSLIDAELNPGTYNYDFDASGLTSGIYFYNLTTDKFSETKKMILNK